MGSKKRYSPRPGPHVVKPRQRGIASENTALRIMVRPVLDEKPLTVIVTLKQAGHDERRAFRKECRRYLCDEKVCQWMADTRGNEIPSALEITGPESNVRHLLTLPIVAYWNYATDCPVLFRAAGSGKIGANARKAIRRATMPKAEREARYQRETLDYRRDCAADDKTTRELPRNVNGQADENRIAARLKMAEVKRAGWKRAQYQFARDCAAIADNFGFSPAIASAIVRRLRRMKAK